MTDPLGRVPVLLSWGPDEQAIEVRGDAPAGEEGWAPVLGEVARFARAALGLADGASVHARTFECHPDDLALLDGAARRFVDERGFARAFAHDGNGDFVVNARYREVAGPGVSAASLQRLIADANTQAALQQIAAQLGDVQAALADVRDHQRLVLESQALSTVEIVDQAWQTYQRSGVVSYTDWDRVAPVEMTLRSTHRQVLGELTQVQAKLVRFEDVDAARQSLSIEPEYVRNLLVLEGYLLRAVAQHVQLSLAVRADRGEPWAVSEEVAVAELSRLREASQGLRARLAETVPDASSAGPGLGAYLMGGVFAARHQRQIVEAACENVSTIRWAVRTQVTSAPSMVRRIAAGEDPLELEQESPAAT